MDLTLVSTGMTVLASGTIAFAVLRSARKCMQSSRPPARGVLIVSVICGMLAACVPLLFLVDLELIGSIAWLSVALGVLLSADLHHHAWEAVSTLASLGERSLSRLTYRSAPIEASSDPELSIEDLDEAERGIQASVRAYLDSTPAHIEETSATASLS